MFTFQMLWLGAALIILGSGIIIGALLLKGRANDRNPNVVKVANSVRLRNTPAYQAALKKLWVQLLITGILASVVGVAAVFGASKPLDVSAEYPEKHNRDIGLCLDASGSMFGVNIAVLEKFEKLVEGFKGERISLTVFNTTTVPVFPLTDDYEFVLEEIDRLKGLFKEGLDGSPEASRFFAATLGRQDGASLIGDGLYGCSLAFDNVNEKGRSRSVIFATDNMLNGVELVPLDEAARILNEQDIKVYGMNPGARGTGMEYVAPEAVAKMKTILEANGGESYEVGDGGAVPGIVDSIQKTEASKMQGSPVIVRHDQAQLALYVILVAAGMFIGYMAWRKQ